MKITFLTMFPESFGSFLETPVIQRAADQGICTFEVTDIRPFAGGSFRHIDDSPYGGGAGMILRPGPVLDALDSVRTEGAYTAVLAPAGKRFTQKKAREYAEKEHLILICGHYEGVDARIYEEADELISVGDYIVTGGELPAMIVCDAVVRLLDGVLRRESTDDESFEDGLLEYPQYTKPRVCRGKEVPAVLLSGNHEAIRKWRRKQSLLLTRKNRPDLFAQYPLSEEEKSLIEDDQE